MLAGAKARIHALLGAYTQRTCREEWERQRFSRFNERPIEFGFVFRQIGNLTPRTVLDVGTGRTSLPHMMRLCGPQVTATDNVRDYWPTGMVNRHYHVIQDDIRDTKLTSRYDMVTCISVLEHVEPAAEAVHNLFSLLNPGGHLVLTCPYTEHSYVRNVYELTGSSYGQDVNYITQSFSRKDLDDWLQRDDATIVEQEFWQFWQGEHWTVGGQIIPPNPSSAERPHQHTCLLLRKGRAT